MNKDDWYRDRILWKANQHKLFDNKCCRFTDLSNAHASLISTAIPEDASPILVFWGSQDKWTVLGTKAVFSFYEGNLVSSELDTINKKISVFNPSGMKSEDVKTQADFISLDQVEKLVWVPAGAKLFALINILRMFPLAEKNSV